MANDLLEKTKINYELSRLADFIIENYEDSLKDYFNIMKSDNSENLKDDLQLSENIKNTVIDYLLKKGYTIDQIYSGVADKDLKKFCKQITGSIKSKDDNIKVQVQAKPVKVDKKIVDKFKSAALVFALAFGAKEVIKSIDSVKDIDDVSKNLGVIASTNEGYNEETNIVKQNTYTKEATQYSLEKEEVDLDRIADDIILICSKKSELLDVTLNNIYFDLNTNRLDRMDKILKILKDKTKDDESLNKIYNQIKDYDVFLDYLISKGYSNPNNSDYYKLQEDVSNYKSVLGNYVPFDGLGEDAQKRVYAVIENYNDAKKVLSEEYKEDVNSLAEEVKGRGM